MRRAARSSGEIRRIGKRIALGLDDELWLVLHLMIAGRLHWKAAGVKLSAKNALAAFDFPRAACSSPRRARSIGRPLPASAARTP